MPNPIIHEAGGRVYPRRVFFSGTGALVKGQGLCYDQDYTSSVDGEAATDPCERRRTRVELPTTSNNRAFAGVTAYAYAAKASGQWVEIYEPGSVCEVAIGVDTVLDTTILTCSCSTADAGRFTQPGFMGRGAAVALQTRAGANGKLIGETDGSGSINGTTLTIGSGFTASGIAAGDKVAIVVGHHASNSVTEAIYTVASVTSDTVIVLTASASDGATSCNWYAYSGNPTALCYLFDGEESGLQEWIAPIDDTASQSMVGGFTNILGGVTVGTGDSTATLADGTWFGGLKGFKLWGALTTNDYVLTITNGVIANHSALGLQTLATGTFDGALDSLVLRWGVNEWGVVAGHGVALA